MKITAKSLKVGQEVKYANVWVKIESVEQQYQKNGKPYMEVKGTQVPGIVRHQNGHKSKVYAHPITCDFKNETMVNVR